MALPLRETPDITSADRFVNNEDGRPGRLRFTEEQLADLDNWLLEAPELIELLGKAEDIEEILGDLDR